LSISISSNISLGSTCEKTVRYLSMMIGMDQLSGDCHSKGVSGPNWAQGNKLPWLKLWSRL
jgi:hypothetical protein